MQRIIPLAVFFVVLGAARVIGSLSPDGWANLSPLGALFFCGMACFGWRGVILPAAAWVLTYPVTNAIQGYSLGAELLSPLLGFACMIGLASFFRKSDGGRIFAGSLLSAIIFYFVTNCLSWMADPLYAPKSLATLAQSLWSGLPGYPPTWMFFRNALMAQALFTGLFLVANRMLVRFPVTAPKAVVMPR